MDIKKLIAVATGEIGHDYDGSCPDVVTGCDSRDPDCPACQIIIEAEQEKQEPVFWYRPHSDGQGYDGPIHDSQIEPVRRESGVWLPLYDGPLPSQSADAILGLRGCNSRHGGALKFEPCIYRMRTTDPGCTGCAERGEDQPAEAGGRND